jgi:hypothetical protein
MQKRVVGLLEALHVPLKLLVSPFLGSSSGFKWAGAVYAFSGLGDTRRAFGPCSVTLNFEALVSF